MEKNLCAPTGSTVAISLALALGSATSLSFAQAPTVNIPVGNAPKAVAFDGANIWVANLHGDTVTKVRPSDGAILGTFPVGSRPGALAVSRSLSGSLNIWVVNSASHAIAKLAVDGALQGTFAVGDDPTSATFDGANVWVTSRRNGTVSKLRASDGVNLGTFTVGTGPYDATFDGIHIWVANRFSNTVTKLRASDGSLLGTFAVGQAPHALAFDGVNIWVANYSSKNVTKLRASDGSLLGTFAVGAGPVALAVDATGHVWVANNASNNVMKLRANEASPQTDKFYVANSRRQAENGLRVERTA